MIMKGSVDVRFPLSRGAEAANKGWEPRQDTLGDRSELPGQRVDQPLTTAGCHISENDHRSLPLGLREATRRRAAYVTQRGLWPRCECAISAVLDGISPVSMIASPASRTG